MALSVFNESVGKKLMEFSPFPANIQIDIRVGFRKLGSIKIVPEEILLSNKKLKSRKSSTIYYSDETIYRNRLT